MHGFKENTEWLEMSASISSPQPLPEIVEKDEEEK
jgi:hypothetical protein